MSYIEWFEKGETGRGLVGGKGASLALLAGAGFPVPPGFTLTTEAYRLFFDAAGLAPGASADAVRERFQATHLPAELADAIDAGYRELVSRVGEATAVRSSAPSEDGGARSSAGLYESYLNVQGIDNVLDAVKRCYLSLWSDRAVGYRGIGSGEGATESMAVVIMSLVPCDTAGVAFTAHPITGDRGVVLINSAWGLGESVVSGAVTPDSFVVRKADCAILEREVNVQTTAVRSQTGGTGTADVAIVAAEASRPSLSDEQAAEVTRLACAVEEHFGTPQDIEFGLAASKLYLLQARPITTLG